jgi:hypothetical protein
MKIAPYVGQNRWPSLLNVIVNIGLVVGTLEFSNWIYWHIAAGWA